jgi:hypothetical protein
MCPHKMDRRHMEAAASEGRDASVLCSFLRKKPLMTISSSGALVFCSLLPWCTNWFYVMTRCCNGRTKRHETKEAGDDVNQNANNVVGPCVPCGRHAPFGKTGIARLRYCNVK